MSATIDDLLQHAIDRKPDDFNTDFSSILLSKSLQALEKLKQDVAQLMLEPDDEEEE